MGLKKVYKLNQNWSAATSQGGPGYLRGGSGGAEAPPRLCTKIWANFGRWGCFGNEDKIDAAIYTYIYTELQERGPLNRQLPDALFMTPYFCDAIFW